jgi:osmotically inducible lipoprotein OsmB
MLQRAELPPILTRSDFRKSPDSSMRALKSAAFVAALGLASSAMAATGEKFPAGAATGALMGGLFGGPIGAAIGGLAGSVVESSGETKDAQDQLEVRPPKNGRGVIERTCVSDRYGNQTCRETVR